MGIHEHDDRLGAEENAGDHQQAEVLPGGHQVAVATQSRAKQQAQVAQDDAGGAGMTDYSELVKKLRDLHRDPRPASAVWLFDNQVALYDAAAAIEELEKERDYYKQQYENRQRLIKSALGEEWT